MSRLFILIFVFFAGMASAQDRLGSFERVEFAAHEMVMYEGEQKAILTGSAHLKGDGMELGADQITVFFIEVDEKREIKDIIGEGNVVFVAEGAKTQADRLDYHHPTRKAVFTGEVKTKQGSNIVNGNELELDIRGGVYKMQGPVRGTLGGDFQ